MSVDRRIQKAPGFWQLMRHLAKIAAENRGADKWHTFTIHLKPADGTVWVSDASLTRDPQLPKGQS